MLLNKSFLFASVLLFGCMAARTKNKTVQDNVKQVPSTAANTAVAPVRIDYSGTPTLVYKTKNDYSQNVPVTLNADKTKIESYPAPADIYYNGKLAYPTALENGYMLDNRGISLNTAFTKYTYEEYSKLKEAPDLKTLYKSVIDKDPILELYNCGNRYKFKNEVTELNSGIKSNNLADYKRIK